MSDLSATHATFVVERSYDASPARVFAAFALPEQKAQWNSCHTEWENHGGEFDFRVGGRETSRVGPAGGAVHGFEAHYHDIVPNHRIIYSYQMSVDDARISVSLTTITFETEGSGTRLVFTEQATFLDGHQDPAEREAGTGIGLDRLGEMLSAELAAA